MIHTHGKFRSRIAVSEAILRVLHPSDQQKTHFTAPPQNQRQWGSRLLRMIYHLLSITQGSPSKLEFQSHILIAPLSNILSKPSILTFDFEFLIRVILASFFWQSILDARYTLVWLTCRWFSLSLSFSFSSRPILSWQSYSPYWLFSNLFFTVLQQQLLHVLVIVSGNSLQFVRRIRLHKRMDRAIEKASG